MTGLELRYHVPRSQVWAGSRGGQSGNVHLHVRGELVSGRLRRRAGAALCSSRPPWWEREPSPGELERLPAGACRKCLELADRHELKLPAELEPDPLEQHLTALYGSPAELGAPAVGDPTA